jgi:hypothetical protein
MGKIGKNETNETNEKNEKNGKNKKNRGKMRKHWKCRKCREKCFLSFLIFPKLQLRKEWETPRCFWFYVTWVASFFNLSLFSKLVCVCMRMCVFYLIGLRNSQSPNDLLDHPCISHCSLSDRLFNLGTILTLIEILSMQVSISVYWILNRKRAPETTSRLSVFGCRDIRGKILWISLLPVGTNPYRESSLNPCLHGA